MTADGLQLRGLFHKSAKDQGGLAGRDPALPAGPGEGQGTGHEHGRLGGSGEPAGAEGYHVFRFDWRGHGKKGSDIKDTERFWGEPLHRIVEHEVDQRCG